MWIPQRQLICLAPLGIAWSVVLGVAVAIWPSRVSPLPALAQSHTFPGRLDAYLKKWSV